MQYNFIGETSKVTNCHLGKHVKIWNNVKMVDSVLSDNVSIGDFSNIKNSNFHEYVNIQRNNWIFDSVFQRYTYTGRDLNCWNSVIGSFCSISWNVSIGAADHNYKKLTTSAFLYSDIFDVLKESTINTEIERDERKCIIGSDVWIGCGAVIKRGIKIGDGAVIGANSVVTKDIQPYTIVAGSPAITIKLRFNPDIIEKLLKIKWWNFPIEIIKNNFDLFNSQISSHSIELLEELKNNIFQ